MVHRAVIVNAVQLVIVLITLVFNAVRLVMMHLTLVPKTARRIAKRNTRVLGAIRLATMLAVQPVMAIRSWSNLSILR
jgi:hypothetical protein